MTATSRLKSKVRRPIVRINSTPLDVLQRNRLVDESRLIHNCARPDEALHLLIDPPHVEVHPGDDDAVLEPEGDELAGVAVAAVDDLGALREGAVARV